MASKPQTLLLTTKDGQVVMQQPTVSVADCNVSTAAGQAPNSINNLNSPQVIAINRSITQNNTNVSHQPQILVSNTHTGVLPNMVLNMNTSRPTYVNATTVNNNQAQHQRGLPQRFVLNSPIRLAPTQLMQRAPGTNVLQPVCL
jgi:hypothetical protein